MMNINEVWLCNYGLWTRSHDLVIALSWKHVTQGWS